MQGADDDAGRGCRQALALPSSGGFLLSTLIFGGVVTGDVVLSIVLIVAGIILTPARPTVTIPGVRV